MKPRTRTNTLCEPGQSKCMSTCHKSHQKSHFIRKFTRRMPRPRTRTHTLCEPAQSKCMSRFHKSHFIQKFTGKMPQTKWSPERGRTLCASLRSRNACQDFTRATLYGNLQVKCRRPEWTPWSSTGLYSYRKNPSVWTHCLGENIIRFCGRKNEVNIEIRKNIITFLKRWIKSTMVSFKIQE